VEDNMELFISLIGIAFVTGSVLGGRIERPDLTELVDDIEPTNTKIIRRDNETL
jgi:hypothetical protein